MIVCQMDMFTYEHRVSIYDDATETYQKDIFTPDGDSIEAILLGCKETNDYHVRLIGPTQFCMGFAELIDERAEKEYGLADKLQIEVN